MPIILEFLSNEKIVLMPAADGIGLHCAVLNSFVKRGVDGPRLLSTTHFHGERWLRQFVSMLDATRQMANALPRDRNI